MAEAGADAAPLPEADLAAQRGGDFATETELDHALYGSVYVPPSQALVMSISHSEVYSP
jgi:hypothetical protein